MCRLEALCAHWLSDAKERARAAARRSGATSGQARRGGACSRIDGAKTATTAMLSTPRIIGVGAASAGRPEGAAAVKQSHPPDEISVTAQACSAPCTRCISSCSRGAAESAIASRKAATQPAAKIRQTRTAAGRVRSVRIRRDFAQRTKIHKDICISSCAPSVEKTFHFPRSRHF